MYTVRTGLGNGLERFFRFKQWNTSLGRDTLAGFTTFIVMSYIIFVNPNILGLHGKGLPFAAALTSTCLVAGIMTILMGLVTNRVFAMAPGMGLNAMVAYSLVAGQGLSFESAMGIIVLEGIVITILVLAGLREAIFRAIPMELKKAIAVGIGFFILFTGLVDGGIVVAGDGTLVGLGDLATIPAACTLFGIAVTIIMLVRRWRSAIILGIILTTILAIILNHIHDKVPFGAETAAIPTNVFDWPDFSLVGAFDFGSFAELGVTATILWVFSFMLSDFFDTMGTLVGVGEQAGYLDQDGNLPDVNRPLLVDSLGAVAGGVVSASSATTYIEAGAGVAQGGRTGWAAIVTGALFLAAMFISPVAGMVPPAATAPALIIVGFFMMATLTQNRVTAGSESAFPRAAIDFGDLAFGIPAVLIIAIMPLTYSITNGIGFGFIAYSLIRIVQGRIRDINWILWLTTAGFLIYFLVPLAQAEGWV